MHVDVNLYPNQNYHWRWLVIGLILLGLLLAWYGLVIWLTRKKKPKILANSKPPVYAKPDLPALKQKYLTLIGGAEQQYNNGEVGLRLLHQQLSYLLRLFVYELKGSRIDTFTLTDLQKSRYQQLAKTIERYYLPEFLEIEQGDAVEAIKLARRVINEWA